MLPASLRGVLYRVGPGRFERGGEKYAHAFDGDGRIDRLEFARGGVRVSSRFVETPQFLAEERAGELLHRRAFGTGARFRLCTLKNEANTALVHHGGELLALWEGGSASAIDPDTLAYLGPHDLGGAARVAPAFSLHPALDRVLGAGGDAVCAHSHVDPATGRRVMLLSKYSMGKTTLRFVEFEPSGFKVHSQREHAVQGFTLVHDFVVTPSSYVFFATPLDFDALAFRRGTGVLDCVTQPPGCARIVRLPRSAAGEARSFDVPPFFSTHMVNAVETPCELVVDTFGLPSIGAGVDVAVSGPRRFVVDLEAGMCFSSARLDSRTSEFPAVAAADHGRVYEHAYYSGTKHTPMDSVVHLDAVDGTKRYSTVVDAFHLEPVLAGDFLLVFMLTSDGAQALRVLEADTLREACRLPIEGTNVMALHGVWVGGS